MGGRARHGRPKGNGSTVILRYMAGQRVDRRLRPVQEVDRWADSLAEQLGAERWCDLPASQKMTVFLAAGSFVLASALLGEYLRTGELGLFERYSAAVGNVRRLLASLGLQAADMEEVGELERALRQGGRVSHDVAPGGDDREGVQG